MRRHYWATGAIAAFLVLFWSCIAPFLGGFLFVGFQSAHAASPLVKIQASSRQAPSHRVILQEQFGKSRGFQAVGNPLEPGILAYAEGRYAEAVAQFDQATSAFSQSGLILEQAQALSYLSLGQQQLGDWTAAERSVNQGLELLSRMAPSREQQITLGRTFNAQGSLYLAKGQAREALTAWQSAEAVYKQAEDETRQLGSLINQSQALQSLGFYARARRMLEDIGQRLERQSPELQLFGLGNLGNMYWRVGNLDESEKTLRKALKVAQTAKQPQQLGGLWVSLGNIEQARNNVPRSLQYYEQAVNQSSGELKFQAMLNQFQLLNRLNEQTQARELISPLNEQLQALSPSRSVLYGATNFSNTLTKLAFTNPIEQSSESDNQLRAISGVAHDVMAHRLITQDLTKGQGSKSDDVLAKIYDPESFQLASQTLTWGMETAQELGDSRAEAYARGYLGHLYELSQQWNQARQLTQRAASQAERIHAQDIGYQWQWQLARIFKAQGQLAPAEKAYQSAFDMLQSLRIDLAAAQPDLQFSFRESVEPIYREFADLLLRPVAPAKEPTPEALELARDVIEALQIAELNNFFHTACLQDQVVSVEKVDSTGAAVLYPIILPDRITLILSLPGQPLRSYSTQVSQDQVERTLGKFRLSLERPYTDPRGTKLAQEIYGWLIKPIEAELEAGDIKTLAFVLDGALRNIPMAALHDGSQYLVETYRIALTPGLQLLDPQTIQLRKKRTLLAGLTEARDKFSALPNVRDELAAIQKVVSNKILLNEDFTRATLEKTLQTSDFPVVHLATHGQFSSNAEDTFILAWDEEVNVQELSAMLQGGDRADPIELLVLSACETASGDDRAALGLAGLSVQAGARSTLASLWSLDDKSGAVFAKKFYQAMRPGNVSRAEALQTAQLELLADPDYRNPQSWASYVLVGNWL